MEKKWRFFLDKLPDDVNKKILDNIFEKDIKKNKEKVLDEFNVKKYFINYMLIFKG